VEKHEIPVPIVGAGAGGLSASTLLAHHGVPSLLVERRRETFVYPKARNLNFRTLEILRGIGLGPTVNASADHISTMVSKHRLCDAEAKPAFDADSFPSVEAVSPDRSENIARKANWSRSCWPNRGGLAATCATGWSWRRFIRTTLA
jgi:putative polyketide hydroxylase